MFDAFTRLGLSLQRPAVRKIISFCDADGNGTVDFREFMLLLGGKETDDADPEVLAPTLNTHTHARTHAHTHARTHTHTHTDIG